MTSIGGIVAIETAFTVVQFVLAAPLFALTSRWSAAAMRDAACLTRRPGAAAAAYRFSATP
jgi:hypothetical protein